MSMVKTAKQEALELFDEIERLPDGHGDAGKSRRHAITRLNILTAKQLGYRVQRDAKYDHWFQLVRPDGEIEPGHSQPEHATWCGVPHWYSDERECLKLPLPDDTCRWELFPSGASDESHGAILTGKARVKLIAQTSMQSLSVAMHKAWWSAQPD